MAPVPGQQHSLDKTLEKAVTLHKAGQLPEAARLYKQFLQHHPTHSKALHLLGLLSHQTGQHAEAAALLQRALAAEPNNPQLAFSLGMMLYTSGRVADAIPSLQKALRLNPQHMETRIHLAGAHRALGQHEAALACLHQGLQAEPNQPLLLNELGIVLRMMKRYPEAIAALERALAAQPDIAVAMNNLGNVYKDMKAPETAKTWYEKAIATDPSYALAYNGLAILIRDVGDVEGALALYRQAVAHQPDYAEAYNNMGNLLMAEGRLDEAQAAFEQAMRVKPELADGYYNRGTVLIKARQVEEGLAMFDAALQRDPHRAGIHWNQAYAWLLKGDYERGWPAFDWRLKLDEFPKRRFDKPMWQGEPLHGERVLVVIEQGFGDTFQFLRYLPLIQERGGHVILECRAETRRLLDGCRGVDHLADQGRYGAQTTVDYDRYVYLLSLPGIFQTTLATVPHTEGLLSRDPALAEHWRERIRPHGEGSRRVGVVWGCESANETYKLRSAPLCLFAPLADMPAVTLVSLQKGASAAQLSDMPFHDRIVDLGPDIQDFADTAAIIENLDLVISIDTSVAHLTGLLNRPGWVLLPMESDWRWLLDRNDSPWYPSLRLFRQATRGDWEPVFAQVMQALHA